MVQAPCLGVVRGIVDTQAATMFMNVHDSLHVRMGLLFGGLLLLSQNSCCMLSVLSLSC